MAERGAARRLIETIDNERTNLRMTATHKASHERDAASDLQPLSPQRLAQIAATLPERERAAFTISLDERLTSLYLEEFTRLAPAQPPDDRMSKSELRSVIDDMDRAVALQPKPAPRVRVDDLNSDELRQLAGCTTKEQAERLLDRFTKARGQ